MNGFIRILNTEARCRGKGTNGIMNTTIVHRFPVQKAQHLTRSFYYQWEMT